MGIICQKCSNSKNDELDKEEDNITKTQPLLPEINVNEKANDKKINITNNNQIKHEITKIKIPEKLNTHISNEKMGTIEENEEIQKSKTLMGGIFLNKNNPLKLVYEKKKTDKENERKRGKMYYSMRLKRSNSLVNPKKLDKLILNLMDNPKKEKKNNINFNQDENKNKNKNKNNNTIQKDPTFKRRRKKSSTLMGSVNLINNLLKVQMSVPVSQQLLVLEQKGNPSDKYIRGKKIGCGSFGTVYEAKNLIFNTKVAMKIIVKQKNMNRLLIKNEIDILKKLSHPNIVRIYEFYESNNCFYLINEYCYEGELYKYINKCTLNEQQLAIIFYQVFSGLYYLHENNILHRDLKPENILISKKEIDLLSGEEYFWIQIIDFGTAKIFEHNKKEKSIVGSAYYIAPEVLKKNYNEKCDTWSVGVILYMFLTGRPPFEGRNHEEIIESITTKELDQQNERLLQRSPEVRDLVRGLLEKDTKKRLSAKEALNHIWFKKYNARKLFENFLEKDIQHYLDNLFNYTFNSKIQQLVIAFLVHNLPTTDSKRNILKLYRYFNTSGDCKLTKEELIKGLSKFRKKEEFAEIVDNLFLFLDSDNNGCIEYEEFLRACIDKKEVLTDEYLKYAFRFLDKENKGHLSVQEINKAFLEEEKNEDKLFEIALTKDISEVDEDGDGIIHFKEFKCY